MTTNKVSFGILVAIGIALAAAAGRWTHTEAVAEPLPAKKADAPLSPPPPADARRPIGTWERDNGLIRVQFRFEQDRMFGTITLATGEGGKVTLHVDADYSVNRENVLFGVVTGVDTEGFGGNELNAEAMQLSMIGTDQPFSFRIRVDENQLTIKDLRIMGLGGPVPALDNKDAMQYFFMMSGRYKKVSAERKNGFDRD